MTTARSRVSDTPGPIVGIDLGTTYSLISVLQGGVPVVLPNALGERLTPSAVSVEQDDTLLVGAPALARATTHPERTVTAFKRDMGTGRTWRLGAHELTPTELSSLVLRALKADAEAALGMAVSEAIITVPAYFGDHQRQATRDAGILAGLRVERILNEPTAAALAYGLNDPDREARVVVLDLGGGTFDVTVLEIEAGCVEVQSSAGDSRLGGEDFLDALFSHAQAELRRIWGDVAPTPVGLARLRVACESAKRRLSEAAEATIAVVALPRVDGSARDVSIPVTRAQAETIWEPVLERLRGPVHHALRDAALRPEQVDEVVLVGGATRMPCVPRMTAQIFGRLPQRNLPPDEAVALGAAVQAGLKAGDEAVEELVATDVAPFTLGVETVESVGKSRVTGIFSPVLERGTVIPASRSGIYSTVDDNQVEIVLEVYQGEHAQCRRNRHLGSLRIPGLPKAPGGQVPVEVRFTYDLNGILEVDATVVPTGKRHTRVLRDRPGKLPEAEMRKALKRMQALKVHPRETLPNRTALERAEALFVELTGSAREELGAGLGRFRAALETQDPQEISAYREALVSLTQRLRETW